MRKTPILKRAGALSLEFADLMAGMKRLFESQRAPGLVYPRRRLRGRGPSEAILWRALIRAATTSSLNGRAL